MNIIKVYSKRWLHKQTLYTCLLGIICLIGFFLRFSNIPAHYGFDADPTRDALIAYYGAHTLHFPLVGPTSGIGSFNFGPWYYYQIIIFSLIFPYMYAPWIYIGISSLLCIIIMYQIGSMLRDKALGLILAALPAFSPAEIGPTTGLSNPNLIPVHAYLILYIFFKYIKSSPTLIWAFLWGIVLGIGINDHFQLILLIFLPVLTFMIKREQFSKRIALLLLGVFLTFIPLLIFNFQNHWYTIKGFAQFTAGGHGYLYVPNSWKIYLFSFWPTFWSYVTGTTVLSGIFLALLTGFVLLSLFFQRKMSDFYLFFFYFGFIFIILRFYSGERHNYYLLFLHPFIFISVGIALWSLVSSRVGKIFVGIIFLLMALSAIPEDIKRLGTREDYVQTSQTAQQMVEHFPSSMFQVYNCQDQQKNIVQGTVFHLVHYGKIADSGRKVGIFNQKCSFQEGKRIRGTVFIDFGHISDKKLMQSGWRPVNPKTVYEETVDWWKKGSSDFLNN